MYDRYDPCSVLVIYKLIYLFLLDVCRMVVVKALVCKYTKSDGLTAGYPDTE